MYLMPKIAGLIDAMLTRGGVARYGGWLRFMAGAAIELVFSFLQGAVSTIRTSIFMIGLLFGKSVVWGGQSRDAQRLSWEAAAWVLWPQTLFGVLVCGALLLIAPAVFWWSLPLTAGYLLAIPFAVLTAHPRLRQGPAAPRPLRHPGGLRYAGGGECGDGRETMTAARERFSGEDVAANATRRLSPGAPSPEPGSTIHSSPLTERVAATERKSPRRA